mmetsp:Transcript_69086/g.140480  ORF Transcript_69086/g.140480 Transcript_69086/m.140480 type:complete len:83 (-) Transcript_69086:11-259(-)
MNRSRNKTLEIIDFLMPCYCDLLFCQEKQRTLSSTCDSYMSYYCTHRIYVFLLRRFQKKSFRFKVISMLLYLQLKNRLYSHD